MNQALQQQKISPFHTESTHYRKTNLSVGQFGIHSLPVRADTRHCMCALHAPLTSRPPSWQSPGVTIPLTWAVCKDEMLGEASCSPDPPRLVSRSSRFQWGLQLQLQSTDLDPNFPKQCSDDLVPCWKEPELNFKTAIRAKLPQSLGMFWSSGFGLSPSLIQTI